MVTYVKFQNLSPTPYRGVVSSSGYSAGAPVYPISGWQSGMTPSGTVAVPVSGATGYSVSVYPSGYLQTEPFSTDVTVVLAVFETEDP